MMRRNDKMLNITEINFETGSEDMLLRGTITDNHLSYQSEIYLSVTFLNRLISDLQKQTGMEDLAGRFETEPMYDEDTYLYRLNLKSAGISNAQLPVSALPDTIRQIRA